jgi:hypothetical protein
MSEDRVLGWDDEISNDSQLQSILLPPGEYPFEIVNLTRSRHTPKSGTGKLPECPKAELTVRCLTPDGSDYADIKNNLFLHSRCEGILCQFFRSIGQRKHGEPLKPDWTRVLGARGRCKVAVRDYVIDGEKRRANEIKSFLDPQKLSGAATPPPQTDDGF